MSSPFPPFSHIKFGDGLGVTDEGSGVIRVDGSVTAELEWEDVGNPIASGLSTAWEVIGGVPTPVAVSATPVNLKWGSHIAGSSLINTAVPTLPSVNVSGLYAFTVCVYKSVPTAGDHYTVFLEAVSLNARETRDLTVTGHGITTALSLVSYMTPSSLLQVRVLWVSKVGGVSPDNFMLDSVSVQQIAAF